MGIGRRFRLLAAAAVAVGLADPGAAQEDICLGLEAELAAVDARANEAWDGGAAAIEAEIAEQRAALDEALGRLRAAGCVGVFAARPGADCRSLTARVGKVRAGLARLNSQRRSLAADPTGLERERSDLLRAFAANGCGRGGTVILGGSTGRFGHGTFETVFGNGRIRTIWGPSDYGADDFSYGTFRTLCVRTCDGYYFPISFATVGDRFADDERTCRARCPGTDVALYVHRNPGAEPEDAVSLAGEPYRSLSTAFRYRKEFDATCRCGAVVASAGPANPVPPLADLPPLTEIAPPTEPLATSGGSLPAPEARGRPAEDPETEANRAGRLAAPSPGPAATDGGRIEVAADGRRIRVVGPSFYVPRNGRPVRVTPLPAPPDER
jgi:hypothetical protein